MPDVLVRQLKCGIGGVAATWFSEIARECAPGPQGRLIVRLPLFCSSWADEGGPIDGL
jgi:hypothetical protein